MRAGLALAAGIFLAAAPARAAEVIGRVGVGIGGIAVTGKATPENTPTGEKVLDPITGRARELGQTWFTTPATLAGMVLFQPFDGLDKLRLGLVLADTAYPVFSRDVTRWGVINTTSIGAAVRLGPIGFELGGGLDEVLVRQCNPWGCNRENVFGGGLDLKATWAIGGGWHLVPHLHATWYRSFTTGDAVSAEFTVGVQREIGSGS